MKLWNSVTLTETHFLLKWRFGFNRYRMCSTCVVDMCH